MANLSAIRNLPLESRPGNKLLASLPRDEFARLRPHLRKLPTKVKQVFQRAEEPIREIVFPNGGVASIITVMQDGKTVETATVGNEGLIGIEAFWGGSVATADALMQVPNGDADTMSVKNFRAEIARQGPLFESVQRYSQGFVALTMRSTACMALHEVQDRCARWLLMSHDRIGRNDFLLSQEFLAVMLGSTRPTVNVVASALQKAGLITYKHGRISILDRDGLEAASCECYAIIKAHFDRLGL